MQDQHENSARFYGQFVWVAGARKSSWRDENSERMYRIPSGDTHAYTVKQTQQKSQQEMRM